MIKGRKLLVPLLAVFLIFAFAFIIWQKDLLKPNQALVIVFVEGSQTGRPLVGLVVEVEGVLVETGEDGRAAFANLPVGLRTFKVSISGFRDFFQTVTLKSGENEEIVFSLEVDTAQVQGRVLDSVTKLPVEEAIVVMGGAMGKTNGNGHFNLAEVITGTPTLKIRKEGYEAYAAGVSLVKGVLKDLSDLFLIQSIH